MQTSSNGRHSVRISGLSTIDFRAGFSRKPTMDFKKTSSRPVQGQWGQSFQIVKKKRHCSCWTFALHLSSSLNSCSSRATVNQLCFKCHVNFFVFLSGIPTHILINTTGLSPLARPDRLELLSVSGEVIKTLPIGYFPERKPYGLWNITEFIPPKEAFFLRVTGFDQDGYLFQRVSSVSFSSIIPGQSVMENMIFWMKIWPSLCEIISVYSLFQVPLRWWCHPRLQATTFRKGPLPARWRVWSPSRCASAGMGNDLDRINFSGDFFNSSSLNLLTSGPHFYQPPFQVVIICGASHNCIWEIN